MIYSGLLEDGSKKIVIPTTSKLLLFSFEQVTNENPSNFHIAVRFIVFVFNSNLEVKNYISDAKVKCAYHKL